MRWWPGLAALFAWGVDDYFPDWGDEGDGGASVYRVTRQRVEDGDDEPGWLGQKRAMVLRKWNRVYVRGSARAGL